MRIGGTRSSASGKDDDDYDVNVVVDARGVTVKIFIDL